MRIYYADHRTARLLKTGRITAALAPRAAAANGGFFYTCLLRFRRKSTPADNGAKNFDWNGEIGCNVRVRMDFRARLVVYKHDNVVIQYGPAIRGTYRKRYSGTVTRAYGRVVAYLTGSFGFPADPNGAFGIVSDPNSVNRNTDSNSYCRRIGRTFSVECHNIRSISFN